MLRKVDGNSPRSSPPPVPSPKIVTALQSGALRPTGSDATPRTATVKRASSDAEKALQRARETAAAAQAVQPRLLLSRDRGAATGGGTGGGRALEE